MRSPVKLNSTQSRLNWTKQSQTASFEQEWLIKPKCKLKHNATALLIIGFNFIHEEIYSILARGFWKIPGGLLWSSVVFVVRCSLLLIVVVVRCCRNAILSPHDFSERLKIWNFGNNKKVASQWADVQQQRKFEKKLIFRLLAIFLNLIHHRFYYKGIRQKSNAMLWRNASPM